jgi:hypothetical protein
VQFQEVEDVLEGWQDWATLHVDDNGIDRWINLGDIRRRINDAGLGPTDSTT